MAYGYQIFTRPMTSRDPEMSNPRLQYAQKTAGNAI